MSRQTAADSRGVSVRVPAKVNLFLAVRGRRPDGYHELVTVMQTVSLYDRLRIAAVGSSGPGQHPAGRRRMRVELWQDALAGLPPPQDNLAVRAAHELSTRTGRFDVGLAAFVGSGASEGTGRGPVTVIDLEKNIPIAGGMGGGSADAAGALVALNELWGCELTVEQLQSIAAGLGSDVPFCVVGGTSIASGRGEALAQVLCRGQFHWVVCESPEPLSTGAVYAAWDRSCMPGEAEPDAVLTALRGRDPVALGAALHNDLEPPAVRLRPDLGAGKEAILEAGALGALVSGSGPTLIGLAADAAGAEELARRLRGRFPRISVAHSPAGGPEVRPTRGRLRQGPGRRLE